LIYRPISCFRSGKNRTVGSFLGMKIVIDTKVKKGEIRLQDKTGRILGRIFTAPEGDENANG
jgi:hypothetical protein